MQRQCRCRSCSSTARRTCCARGVQLVSSAEHRDAPPVGLCLLRHSQRAPPIRPHRQPLPPASPATPHPANKPPASSLFRRRGKTRPDFSSSPTSPAPECTLLRTEAWGNGTRARRKALTQSEEGFGGKPIPLSLSHRVSRRSWPFTGS